MTNRTLVTFSLLTFLLACGDSTGTGAGGAGGAGANGGGGAGPGGGSGDACEELGEIALAKCGECPDACDAGGGGAGGGTGGTGGAGECDVALATCITPCIESASCGALDGTDADAQADYLDCIVACDP